MDISVLIGLFLANYVLSEFDLYSNIDPIALKYTFDNLHKMLKELNWKPPKKNPFSLFHYSDDDGDNETTFKTNTQNIEANQQPIANYEHLFFPFIKNNVNMYNLWYSVDMPYDEVLENEEFNIVKEKIDIHNNSLKHLKKKDFFQETNMINKKLAHNDYVDNTLFYNSSFLYHKNFAYSWDENWILSYTGNLAKESFFFKQLAERILDDIARYNGFMAAKLYYENEISEDKKDLANEFKKAWDRFYVCNTFYLLKNYSKLINYDQHVPNMLRKDLVYKEIVDNILIVGSSILSLIYVHDNLCRDFIGPDNNIFDIPSIDNIDFFDKVWNYYDQSTLKYYALFDTYNWHCKLYMLNEYSRDEILNNDYYNYYHSVHDRYCGYENRPAILDRICPTVSAEEVMETVNEPLKVSKSIFSVKHDLKNFVGLKKFYTERQSIFFKEVAKPCKLKYNINKPIINLEKIFPSAKDILIKKVH